VTAHAESATFAWLNTNKRSIIADLASPADARRNNSHAAGFERFTARRTPAAIMRSSAISHEALRQSEPGLAITAISWFGEAGPYRDYAATDSRCCAAALLVWSNWSARSKGRRGVAARRTDRRGRRVDRVHPEPRRPLSRAVHPAPGVSRSARTEAMLQISEFDTGLALEAGFTRPRIGINRFAAAFRPEISPPRTAGLA